MKTIKITDEGQNRYTLSVSDNCLGRMYDNNAEYIFVEKPDSEADSICTMIVTCMDVVVDHINVGNEPIPIRSNISQYESVRIGFAFTKADGYIKNSESKKFKFLEAQKPDDFIPVEPAQKVSIEYLLQFGFSSIEKEGTNLKFLNVDGEVVSNIDMATFSQVQADMAEEDEENVAYIKNKSTKNMKNEGEDGTSPFATERYVDEHGGKINEIYVNGEKLQPNENKAVFVSVITKVVDDLINYYSKTETDKKFEDIRNLISAIPKFNIQVVEMLPLENIDSFSIYLLKSTDPSIGDLFTEFLYINGAWECLGSLKIDLSQYPQFKDLSSIALSGKLADAISDENHRTVKDEDIIYWNNKANKSDIPTHLASFDGYESIPSKPWVLNEISKAGETLASAAIKDIMIGTYTIDITGLENIPELTIPTNLKISRLSESLEQITAYRLDNYGKKYPVAGYAVFMNPDIAFLGEGTFNVEICFIPVEKGYNWKYEMIEIVCDNYWE